MNYGVDLPVLEPCNSLVLEAKYEGISGGFFYIKIRNSLPGICLKLSCIKIDF